MENINKIWPKWEPVEVLGEGGFGKVYKAKRSDIEAYSAIKVIKIPNNQSEVKEMTSSGSMPILSSNIFNATALLQS